MANVSRPLIALLVASVAFFAVWMVALKPSDSNSGSSGGSNAYQSAIAKAHQAVTTANGASVAHGGAVAGAAATTGAAATPATTSTPATPSKSATLLKSTPGAQVGGQATATHAAAKGTVQAKAVAPLSASATRAQRLKLVTTALRAEKVVALLFYNTAAADDRAVKQELAAVPTHGSRVVKLAVPLTELAQYTVVTNQVPVTASPTLVLVDRTRHATTIVGFADRFEIAQRVDDALTVPANGK